MWPTRAWRFRDKKLPDCDRCRELDHPPSISAAYADSGSLTTNASAYTLVTHLATPANDIADNASGNYVLVNSISAVTYLSSPVATELSRSAQLRRYNCAGELADCAIV